MEEHAKKRVNSPVMTGSDDIKTHRWYAHTVCLARGGKSGKFNSSKSTTSIKFYLSTNKIIGLKIYSSKSKK